MPKIPDHKYRILTVGGSRSRKTNSLFSLMSHQPKINKVYYMLKIHLKQISKNVSNITAPKNVRLISTHYFITKIPNKRELHQIAFNH